MPGGKCIEDWIREHVALAPASSVKLRYERMERQAAEPLPWVHRPADPSRPFDWVDACVIGAFLSALGGARRVLDLGTGDGWPALPLARRLFAVVAVDASPRRCRVARENALRFGLANVEVVCARAERLPFPDGHFDGVVAATSIEQCSDPVAALQEVLRVLRPGGAFAGLFEDLGAEMKGDVEEEAELYPVGGKVVYRLLHRSRFPPREAEYELVFRGSERLSRHAGRVPPVPSFRASREEPGFRPVTPEDELLGIPFLSWALPRLERARWFELRHRPPGEWAELLEEVGFADVRAHGHVAKPAAQLFLSLSDLGLLPRFSPHMEELSRAVGGLYRFVPPGTGSVCFLEARRP